MDRAGLSTDMIVISMPPLVRINVFGKWTNQKMLRIGKHSYIVCLGVIRGGAWRLVLLLCSFFIHAWYINGMEQEC